jgi:hypothetical protein
MFQCLFLGDVLACLANNDGKLAFVVELVLLAYLWDGDVLVEAGYACSWLDEDGWVRGRLSPALLD